MYCFIFGPQRRVWCPKWTPASSRSLIADAPGDSCRRLGAAAVGTVVSDNTASLAALLREMAPRVFRPLAGSNLALAELEPGAGAFCPYFLRSLMRASRVRKPAFFSLPRSSALKTQSAREIAVADRGSLSHDAPAVDRGDDVEVVVRLGRGEGLLDDLLQGLDPPKYSSRLRSFSWETRPYRAKVHAGDRRLAFPVRNTRVALCSRLLSAPATG